MIEGSGIARFDNGSPRQRPQARIDLYAEGSMFSRLRWRVSTTGLLGGPPEDASGAGLIDLGHSFQNVSPSLALDEAYLDLTSETLDLRLGKQKFGWGRLDGVQPNDQLNPRRFADPFLTDEVDSKIAVPAMSASYFFPISWRDRLPEEARLTLVWEPVAVPWLFPLEKERWFPPAATSPSTREIPGSVDMSCPCTVNIIQSLRSSRPPARQLDNGNLGMRLSGRAGDADWALVYFDGFDSFPSFDVPIHIEIRDDPKTPQRVELDAITELRPAYERYRAIGVDGAMPLGGATVRAEGAWKSRRPYPFDVRTLGDLIIADEASRARAIAGDTFPAFAKRDAIEWGIGADYLINGYMPLVELYQVVLIHNDQRLLVRDVDTRLTLNLRKLWMADRLEGQILAIWGIEAGYQLARTQLTYALTDQIQLRVGVLGIFGSENSLLGQYKRNDEAFARIRYTF